MPRGSSTLYDVYHFRSGTTVKRMRINDTTMSRAENGEINYENNIAMAFRRRFEKDNGYDPGWIDFDELEFTVLEALGSVP